MFLLHVHSYWGLEILQKKKAQNLAKFSFYIKRLAPFDLAQRETSPAILFSASVSILDRIAKTWFDTFPQSLNVAET